MGLGTRKRNGDSPVAVVPDEPLPLADADDDRREAVTARLFDGVLRSARSHLLRAEQPLAAEVWASGLLAVWHGLPAGPGDEPGGGFIDALIRHAQAVGTAEALATLLALAAVAPGRAAAEARTAAAAIQGEGQRPGLAAPAWVGTVGTAVPTEAWIGSDVYGDQEIVILGFVHPGQAGGGETESAHSICVLVDHNQGGAAKDAYPAAALVQTLARWRDAEGDGIGLRPVSLPEAAARLTDALVATDFSEAAAAGRDRGLADMRALLVSRLATLPPAESTGVGELDHEGREWLVAEFLGSPEAADLLSEPGVVDVCHSLIAYRCDYGDGDPLRWSPTLAGLCLLDHFPVKVSLEEPDLALVPPVLAAWVTFAGRRRGLSPAAVTRILDAIDDCRPDFAVAMGDGSRWSPAKRAAMGVEPAGVELAMAVATAVPAARG